MAHKPIRMDIVDQIKVGGENTVKITSNEDNELVGLINIANNGLVIGSNILNQTYINKPASLLIKFPSQNFDSMKVKRIEAEDGVELIDIMANKYTVFFGGNLFPTLTAGVQLGRTTYFYNTLTAKKGFASFIRMEDFEDMENAVNQNFISNRMELSTTFSISPNPFSNSFEIGCKSLDCKNYRFEILDLNGIVLKNGRFESEHITIHASEWPAGVYFLKTENSITKKIQILKVIKGK